MWHSKEEPKTARELEIVYLLLSRLLREEEEENIVRDSITPGGIFVTCLTNSDEICPPGCSDSNASSSHFAAHCQLGKASSNATKTAVDHY